MSGSLFLAPPRRPAPVRHWHSLSALAVATVVLAACSTGGVSLPPGGTASRPMLPPVPELPSAPPVVTPQTSAAWQWADSQPLPAPLQRGVSVWQPVRWRDLPGWGTDRLHEAWNAWLRSCERPMPGIGALCAQARQLSIGTVEQQHEWIMRQLQPYKVQSADGNDQGTLTGYYEPTLLASRHPTAQFRYPLYQAPPSLRNGQKWFTRQEIDTHPSARAELQGREIAWLQDPIDAMLLHIQGSGRLQLVDGDGNPSMRVAFAATNNHPYRSITTWLASQGAPTVPWPGATKIWAQQNPNQINALLWSNPRYVFFREETLTPMEAQFGPKGAQGVPLTPGRSIAVDRNSIPYGTPVWLQSVGPSARLQKMVLAQDTGTAIVGAVRADYFTGWGEPAFALAAGMKQPLQLWVLWPRQSTPPLASANP